MRMYDAQVERQMVNFYRSLSEKDRRRYAAVEAVKLGHGGPVYLADLFGCDPDTASASTNTRFGLLLVFIHRDTKHPTPLFS